MRRPIRRRGLLLLSCPIAAAFAAFAGLSLSSPQSDSNRGPSLEAAKLLLARGDGGGAERILRELSGVEAKFLLAKYLAERGRWSEARAALLEAASHPAKRTEALRLLAKGSMETGDLESARHHLLELEKERPRDHQVLKALAVCLGQLGEPHAALAVAQRGLDLAPDDRDLVTLMSDLALATASFSPPRGKRLQVPQPLTYRRRNR